MHCNNSDLQLFSFYYFAEKSTSVGVSLMTRIKRPGTRAGTYRSTRQSTLATPIQTEGVGLIIPILATLLVCTLLLILATMLYR